ncbi:calmodulin-like [Tubulanus polymorphus]|uniref:calmodulin-like n=1 Tax=Tubulanus polymorphus TaxID=672921 RepID=UPI003DA3007F
MANELTPAQKAEYEDAFKMFDKNHDGKITSKELEEVFKALGKNTTEERIQAIIRSVDEDGNGTIELDEFYNVMVLKCKKMSPAEEAKAAFKIFDQNGDGFITPTELRSVMDGLGEVISKEEVEIMIREADLDGDGKINYEEFLAMMSDK